MPQHPPTQRFAPAQPGDPIFIAPLPCIGCAYDLRAMGLASRCPECARPASHSLRSLHAADRADLATLISGLRLLFWPAAVAPLIAAVLVGIDIWRQTDGPQASILGLLLTALVGPCIALPGAVRFGAVVRPVAGLHPRTSSPLLSASRPLRVLAIVYACSSSAAAAVLALALLDVPRREPPEVALWSIAIGAFIAGCTWCSRNILACTRAAHLCAISNRPGLRRCFVVGSFVSAFGILVFLGYGVFGLLARFDAIPWSYVYSSRTPFQMVFVVLQLLVALINFLGLGWLVLWPVLLALLARHLTSIHRRPFPSAADLIGSCHNPDAQFYSSEHEPPKTEPRAQASDKSPPAQPPLPPPA